MGGSSFFAVALFVLRAAVGTATAVVGVDLLAQLEQFDTGQQH